MVCTSLSVHYGNVISILNVKLSISFFFLSPFFNLIFSSEIRLSLSVGYILAGNTAIVTLSDGFFRYLIFFFQSMIERKRMMCKNNNTKIIYRDEIDNITYLIYRNQTLEKIKKKREFHSIFTFIIEIFG